MATVNKQLQQVSAAISKAIEDIQNFLMQTTQLEYTTLPGLKEGFGVDDIISIGVTAGLKKAMNDKIHDTIGLISQSTPTVIKYQANLDEFQPLADNIAMLGDLLNFYKQKALMLLTVHAFNAADVKWSDDGTLAQVQAIVDMLNKVKDLRGKLQTAYDQINSKNSELETKINDIRKTFTNMKSFLISIGKKDISDNPKDITGEFVALQTAFNGIYTQYTKLKPLFKENPEVFDAIAMSIGKDQGYGNINNLTFFLILYAQDFLTLAQIPDFLQKYKCQVPPGGIQQLVSMIDYVRRVISAPTTTLTSVEVTDLVSKYTQAISDAQAGRTTATVVATSSAAAMYAVLSQLKGVIQ